MNKVYCYYLNGEYYTYDVNTIPEGTTFQEFDLDIIPSIEFIKYNPESNMFYVLSETEINNILKQRQVGEKKNLIFQRIKQIEDSILSKYPQSEIYSWGFKVIEANKIISNNYTEQEIPIIFNELNTELKRNPTSDEILIRANEILQRKNEYSILTGKIAGVRKILESMTDDEILALDLDLFISSNLGP